MAVAGAKGPARSSNPVDTIFRITIFTALATAGLFAVSVNAGTVVASDPNSDFTVTYDDTETGAFGTLFLSHNTIFFVPDNFATTSLNSDGQTMISETLNLQLDATTPGFTFDVFLLHEDGDYIVDGASTEVSASGEMRVRDAANPMQTFQDGFVFIDTGDLGPGQQNWEGNAAIDASDGWNAGATKVFLTLQNTLTANSIELGEGAFIQKKFEGVQISVNPVPVPAAVWLLGSAVLGLIGYRSKRG